MIILFKQETQNFCVEIKILGNPLSLRCIHISFISSLICENCCITLMIHLIQISGKNYNFDSLWNIFYSLLESGIYFYVLLRLLNYQKLFLWLETRMYKN